LCIVIATIVKVGVGTEATDTANWTTGTSLRGEGGRKGEREREK
jgi:hypothetical protein